MADSASRYRLVEKEDVLYVYTEAYNVKIAQFEGCVCRAEADKMVAAMNAPRSEQQPSDTVRLKWLLDDYRRIDLHNTIGTMSYDLDVCRKAIDKAMQSERKGGA